MGLAKPQKSLKKWTNEDWGTRSGKNSTQGSKATGERYLPKKARQALSPQEYAATTRNKRRSLAKGEQFSGTMMPGKTHGAKKPAKKAAKKKYSY